MNNGKSHHTGPCITFEGLWLLREIIIMQIRDGGGLNECHCEGGDQQLKFRVELSEFPKST